MKIILLQDVKSLGKKGDIVEASDGYARNYLMPKKLGCEANPQNMNTLRQEKAAEVKRAKEELEAAKELAKVYATKSVKLSIKVGKEGRTFGSVSGKEIATEAKKQCGLDIDKKKMDLPEPIRTPGIFNIPVKLHPEVTATIKVEIQEKV